MLKKLPQATQAHGVETNSAPGEVVSSDAAARLKHVAEATNTEEARWATQVPTAKGALPTTPILRTFPSTKSGSPIDKLLNKGFALYEFGRADEALAVYRTAGDQLREQLIHELGTKLTGLKFPESASFEQHLNAGQPNWVAGDNNYQMDPALKMGLLLNREKLFDQVSPELRQVVLKHLHLTALATARTAEQYKPGSDLNYDTLKYAGHYNVYALNLDPNYGPANYTAVALHLRFAGAAEGVTNPHTSAYLLGHLQKAIDDNPTFYKNLAANDPDLNPLRSNKAFLALIGQ